MLGGLWLSLRCVDQFVQSHGFNLFARWIIGVSLVDYFLRFLASRL